MVLAYIVCKNSREAERISRHLLKKRVIACANTFPIRSLYHWNGKLIDGRETAILAKTSEKRFPVLEREVEKMHSYEIPCILRIPSKANAIYQRWVDKEVQ
ncbi:MAG TPA: divalent-cation tolerance protein CutA [Thermodesulfovibrionia bacterium]|nr:divalent-cation tolerance protein CutA [Thermodesulfovibrionia bacterium]